MSIRGIVILNLRSLLLLPDEHFCEVFVSLRVTVNGASGPLL